MANGRTSVVLAVVALGFAAGSTMFGQTAKQDQHKPDTHTHAAAAKIPNPVTADAASIAAGEKSYSTHCAMCHGATGAGDGVQASKYNPRPSNIMDAEWKHGPSDGEIFTVIRNGVPKTAMAGFSKKLNERQTWDVVNYIRSIGPKAETPHAH